MKNKITLLLLILTNFGYSQINDISFTLSPVADYTWWDNKAGLEDGPLYGGKLGFGFGEYIELRAIYMQSSDLKTNFEKYGITGFSNSLYTPQKINLTRWGGEFKANLGTGGLNPYLTIGSGVQNIEIDGGADFDQIYTSVGLGIKTKLSDRVVFTIEGKNNMYNFDAGKNLLTAADKTAFGVTDADFSSELLSNWSIQGSLQFYLGGREPGKLSDLDRAYLQKFRGGFKGLRWVIEPSANYIEFDDNSLFRNTWLLGAYAGLDFNRFTGIRAFYLKATENDELSTKFDKFSMYGLEFRARLNDGNGVTPYLVLGGGYLNPEDSYLGKNNVPVEGDEFASAGLGLNIPLGKNFLITGGARALITSSIDAQDLAGPDQLQTHMMYNAGIKMTFGNKSKDPDDIYKSEMNTALTTQDKALQADFTKKSQAQKALNEKKLADLRLEYKTKLDSLQVELENANATNNVEKAVEVLEQKKEAKKSLDEVEKVAKKSETENKTTKAPEVIHENKTVEKIIILKDTDDSKSQTKELIKMSPAELELLIDKILDKTDPSKKSNNIEYKSSPQNKSEVDVLKMRLDVLEKMLLEKKASPSIEKKSDPQTDNNELQREMELLKLQMEYNNKKMELLKSNNSTDGKTIIINPGGTEVIQSTSVTDENPIIEEDTPEDLVKAGRFINNERPSNLSESLTYKGASIFTGVNVGGQTAINVGVRMNYGMPNTKFEFMPEFYYGFSNPSSFGLSGNFIYPFSAFNNSEFMTPYAGIGAGVLKNEGDVKFNHNILLGTNLKFGNGRVFVDYTIRNFFKYNQIALGYRFAF